MGKGKRILIFACSVAFMLIGVIEIAAATHSGEAPPDAASLCFAAFAFACAIGGAIHCPARPSQEDETP